MGGTGLWTGQQTGPCGMGMVIHGGRIYTMWTGHWENGWSEPVGPGGVVCGWGNGQGCAGGRVRTKHSGGHQTFTLLAGLALQASWAQAASVDGVAGSPVLAHTHRTTAGSVKAGWTGWWESHISCLSLPGAGRQGSGRLSSCQGLSQGASGIKRTRVAALAIKQHRHMGTHSARSWARRRRHHRHRHP